jgi:hypothetical protein
MLSQANTAQHVATVLRRSGRSNYVFSDDAIIVLHQQTRARHRRLDAVIDTAVFLAALERIALVTAEQVERAISLNDTLANFFDVHEPNFDAFGRWPMSSPNRISSRKGRRSNPATRAVVALAVCAFVALLAMPLDRDDFEPGHQLLPATNEAQIAPVIGTGENAGSHGHDQARLGPSRDLPAIGPGNGLRAGAAKEVPSLAEYSFSKPGVSNSPSLPPSDDEMPSTAQVSEPPRFC